MGPASPSPSRSGGRLAVRGVAFDGFGPYDLTLAAGSCAGISGGSGSGKSRLLRAIADLDRHRGAVELDGRPCRDVPAPEWRRLVSLVPTESRWWHPRVDDHFPAAYDRAAAVGLAEACGFEEGVLGWPVERLSTGEKQRLSVIRALLREPLVLLLDEVGSGLDAASESRLEALIEDYRRSRRAAVVWVSHRPEQLDRVADHLLVLSPGGLAPGGGNG